MWLDRDSFHKPFTNNEAEWFIERSLYVKPVLTIISMDSMD